MRRLVQNMIGGGLIAASLATVIAVALTPDPDNPPNVSTCERPHGAGQSLCWEHDARSGWILNQDNGRTFYVVDTGDVITR